MARRSARLQKQRSPTPDSSRLSWETAPSREQSPAHEKPSSAQEKPLPALPEVDEPAMKTPQKPAGASKKTSQLPQPSSATKARTPNNRTPMKPAGVEMHPAHHHASTAKILDEARWLGFQALGAHTAPPKPMGLSAGQDTPTKATPGSKLLDQSIASPDAGFRFRFKSPLGALSPSSSKILKDVPQETEGRGLFKANEFTAPVDVTPKPKRKTVVPKGKMARFSDAHMKEFKKMDSIANHPSVMRAPHKSTSKADLSKAESSEKTPNKLKRTQSKMELIESMPKVPTSSLKHTQSKADLAQPSTTKITPTPLKRTQSKIDMAGSSIARSQSTVRVVPPSRDGPVKEDNPFVKRVKRTEADDAGTTRPASRDGAGDTTAPTPARKPMASSLASRLMTPTKSSIARAQSAKPLKSRPMISGSLRAPSSPSLVRSPSIKNLFSLAAPGASLTKNMFSPTGLGNAVKDGVRDGIRKTSSSLQRVRSILRTPNRKFSDDPQKVAAGTHLSPPTSWNADQPVMPRTAPVKKHVNFTNSVLENTEWEVGKSPSPMKFRAGSEVPSGAVLYPKLDKSVDYPTIAEDHVPASASALSSRRLTFGGASEHTPAGFSFQSDKSIEFGPSTTGTIRMVRKSDASSLVDGKKRKLDTVSESSDKENSEPAHDVGRSAKKVKTAPAEVPQTPSKSASKLPRRTPRGSSISKSRLAFLATPKRGKA